jgi:ribonuclease P protein subunit RPR2
VATGNRRIRVLIVDDDPGLCAMLRAALELEGIEVVDAQHVIEAEKLLMKELPDAIVLDLGLPGVDGVFYCERLRETPRTSRLPIVAISGSEVAGARATAGGADAFLMKPLDPLNLVSTLERLVGVTPLVRAFAQRKRAGESADLRRLIQIGQRQHDLLTIAYRETLEALAGALESRDFGTSAHSRRVVGYATRLTLEISPSLVDDPTLEWGFLLHDVGKIGIPDQVLLKPGRLTPEERRCIEQHTLIGERLVGHVPLLQGEGIRVVRSHHERWNGAGYPDGTSGTDIPLAARIFSAADALDAMTASRPYRAAIPWDDAVRQIAEVGGTHFDPDVIEALTVCEGDLQTIFRETQTLAA